MNCGVNNGTRLRWWLQLNMIYPVVVFSIRIDGEIWIDVMVVTQQCELGAWVIVLVS